MSTPTLTTPAPCLPPPDRDRVVGILEAAAARLRDKGWQRGNHGPECGPNCVMGAVKWAARQEGRQALAQTVQGVLEQRLGYVPMFWNDEVCPSAQAAVDALLATAKEVANDVR